MIIAASGARGERFLLLGMQQMNRGLIDALAVSGWCDTKANGPNGILDLVFEKAVAHDPKIITDRAIHPGCV